MFNELNLIDNQEKKERNLDFIYILKAKQINNN